MEPSADSHARSTTETLLWVVAAALLLLSIGYNEFVFGSFIPTGPDGDAVRSELRHSEAIFLGLAGLAALLALALRVVPALREVSARPGATNALLATLFLVAPLGLAELGLRPWFDTEAATTIFQRDADLGWRMRPGADDLWSGVRIQINENGLRGPAVDYERSPVDPKRGVAPARVLYLGDSVTFGFGLESHDDTYPYQVAALLREGGPVETINAAVSGYSPWQQHRWLLNEGLRYAPDLVVVGFVLNDVTEKLGLSRFGGTGEGWQLEHTVDGGLQRALQASSLVAAVRAVRVRQRFGDDPREAARLAELSRLFALVNDPEREDIREAWALTLESLGNIFDTCERAGIPALLVVFPLSQQVDGRGAKRDPQRRLLAFAAGRRIPALDLLSSLVAASDEVGTEALFIDWNHLTAEGNRVVADPIARIVSAHLSLGSGSKR